MQKSPLDHKQGGQPDIDAKTAGASVSDNGKEKRLSKTLAGLFKLKGKD